MPSTSSNSTTFLKSSKPLALPPLTTKITAPSKSLLTPQRESIAAGSDQIMTASTTNNKSDQNEQLTTSGSKGDTKTASVASAATFANSDRTATVGPSNNESGDGCFDLDSEQTRTQRCTSNMSVEEFLGKLKVEAESVGFYSRLFEKEKICMEVLAEMGHDQLKEIGVEAFGDRHKILKGRIKFYEFLVTLLWK